MYPNGERRAEVRLHTLDALRLWADCGRCHSLKLRQERCDIISFFLFLFFTDGITGNVIETAIAGYQGRLSQSQY